MAAEPLFVLVHSPLLGPYSWGLVEDALRARAQSVVVPVIRSLEQLGPPYWQRHIDAIAQASQPHQADRVVLVGHSGAGRLLPVTGEHLTPKVAAYVFVDSDIPTRTESRLDGIREEDAQQFRDAAEGGFLLPWPEEVFEDEIKDDQVRAQLISELAPLPLAVYEEEIPLPPDWPDARCAYIRLSDQYPDAEAHARHQDWDTHRFEGGHFFILVGPDEVASALIDIASQS